MRDKIGNTAVLSVRPDGKAKFVESKDWGAGRGALLGGAIGILGGPLGIIAGGSIGALVSKLRDSGFKTTSSSSSAGRCSPTARRSWSRSPATRSTRRRNCSSHSGRRTSSWKISTITLRRSSRRTRSPTPSPSRLRPRASLPPSERLEWANLDRLSPRDRGGARGTRRPHDRREPARLHTGLCAERGLSNSSSSRRHALAIVPFKPIPG